MDLSKLEEVLKEEPKYRLRDAKDFVFVKLIENWNEVTSFSKELRERLNKECPLEIKAQSLVSKSEDSVKSKIILKDLPAQAGGFEIEAVLMRHKDGRNTVCVSSQVGCPMGCLFCATGTMGLKRNLTADEILEQVIFFDRYLKNHKERVTNVTFMGMGEPFLNYENVLNAISILNDLKAFGISIRNISISTCGVTEGIEKLADSGLQINLAISLHAPNNELRGRLMPINKKYPLDKVLNAVDDYIKKTKRKVMFEYVLIKDINDTDECAKELAGIMKKKLYFLNLITFNTVPGSQFLPSSSSRIDQFKKILKKEKINFVQRYKFGQDIQAACGQFVTGK